MHIFHGLPEKKLMMESVLTIGVFDGIHRGHQALIARVQQAARAAGRWAGVMSLHPHPIEVLAPGRTLRYLTDIETRARLLEKLGVDFFCVMPFTAETAGTFARDFVWPLVERLRMRELVIGPDFTLGYQRQGDAPFLRALGAEWGFALQVVEPLLVDGEVVSSSRIRRLLAAGEQARADELLGHALLEKEKRL